MTKNELQEEAINTFISYKRLILEFATGTGKSRVAIEAIKRIKPKNVLLVVAETLHKDNWKDEFKKWGASRIFKTVTVECYASLHKYKNTSWDVVIMDEAHHVGTDMKIDILSSIKSEYVMCLSATFPKKVLLPVLEEIYGKFKIRTIGLQKAIDNNILPEPVIYTIPLQLDSNIASETFIEEWGKDELKVSVKANYQTRWVYKKNRTLYPNIRMEVSCTPYQKYLYLCDQYNYWKKLAKVGKNKTFAANKQMRWGSERKVFLGTLKTKFVPKLLDTIKDRRYVCFCTNIEQCDILGKEYSVHSKKDNPDSIVEDFNNLKTNRLFFVLKGIEGMNFNDIEVGIIVQLFGKEIKVQQSLGRFMRAEKPEIYIFYYKNTRDEEYLNNAIDGIDKKYIKQLNYEDIGNNRPAE